MLGGPAGRARRAAQPAGGREPGPPDCRTGRRLSEASPTLRGMADDGVPVPPEPAARRRSLSPSRAGDFLTCPLLYRFRVIDRLPEPPSPAAARGTLVHAVLEHLFDRPAPERTPEAARSLLDPEWDRLVTGEPELGSLFAAEPDRAAWLAGGRVHAGPLLHPGGPDGGWSPPTASCAWRPSSPPGSGCAVTSTGWTWRRAVATRIVDYKTGSAPPAEFEARALFQMKFYALVLWRARGPPAPAAPAHVPGQRGDCPLRA